MSRGDVEIRALRHEIADLLQKRAVGGEVQRLASVLFRPGVDLTLQAVTDLEKAQVLGDQIDKHLDVTAPEILWFQTQIRQDIFFDQIGQNISHLQSSPLDVFRHLMTPCVDRTLTCGREKGIEGLLSFAARKACHRPQRTQTSTRRLTCRPQALSSQAIGIASPNA